MNNKKLGQDPIVPTVFRQIGENEFRTATEKDLKDNFATFKNTEGMSKRFYAACAAMQGLLSRDLPKEQDYYYTEILIQKAYRYADELLKQE